MKAIVLMYRPTGEHLRRLHQAAPGCEFRCVDSEAAAREAIRDAAVVLGNRYFMQSLPYATRLEWMQSNSVGMDLLLSCERVRRGNFVLTNARGVYDRPMADHALALTLALTRGLPDAFRRQQAGEWHRAPLQTLADLPTVLFGFGALGQEIAKRLMASGSPLRVVVRTPNGTGAQAAANVGIPCCDCAAGLRALGEVRLVILALPLTDATRGLFGKAALRALPDGAYLVNVSRGGLIEEDELHAEIDRLGGVALDVCDTEPLPPDHWLWRHPKILITPHVGRAPEHDTPRWLELFETNVGRWVRGEPLLNVVDKELGY